MNDNYSDEYINQVGVSGCVHSAGYGECLLDRPSKDLLDTHRASKRLPGENFDENKQCEFVFGNRSKICPYMVNKSMNKPC